MEIRVAPNTDPEPGMPENCDFCGGPRRPEAGVFLIVNKTKTEAICNICVFQMHKFCCELAATIAGPTGVAN